MIAETKTRCVWCGAWAFPVEGVYLAMLYPGRTTCSGCGRIQLHCTCARRIMEAATGRLVLAGNPPPRPVANLRVTAHEPR
jgi:hypothetical protein